jgi:hypothetical protein
MLSEFELGVFTIYKDDFQHSILRDKVLAIKHCVFASLCVLAVTILYTDYYG